MKKSRRKRKQEKLLTKVKSLPENVAFKMSKKDAIKAELPYLFVNFKTGPYRTKKDKPRDNNWRKWASELFS